MVANKYLIMYWLGSIQFTFGQSQGKKTNLHKVE